MGRGSAPLRAHRAAGSGRRCALLRGSDARRYDLVVVDPGPWPRVLVPMRERAGLSGIGRPAAEDRRLGLLGRSSTGLSSATLGGSGGLAVSRSGCRARLDGGLARRAGGPERWGGRYRHRRQLPRAARRSQPRGSPAQHPGGLARRPQTAVVRRCLLAPDAVSPGRPSGAGATANDVVPEAREVVDRRGCRLGHDGSRRPLPPALCWFSPRLAGRRLVGVAGYDPRFGRTLPALFERSGLENINHETSTAVVRGGCGRGGTGKASTSSPRPREASPRNKDVSRRSSHQRSADPSVWSLRELLHACSGRRPG